MTRKPVELIRVADGAVVEGALVSGLSGRDLELIEREWTPARGELLRALLVSAATRSEWPQTLGWDWGRKGPELKLLESSGYGLIVSEKWQGAMLTKTASHFAQLDQDKGKPLVYVDYIESAPWNWNVQPLGRAGDYKAVGGVLITEAVLQSVEEGFDGRVGLHAVPQAEAFYRRCGMTPLAEDPAKQNLRYFEFSREQARQFLS